MVQRSPKPDDDASKDHAGIKSYRSVDEVYQDPEVDVVVISTIPETHYDMCKRSLEAGKHVVVEKPFLPTSKEAEDLIEIARKTGKKLAVYQNRRWDVDFLTLQKIISEGSLGDIAEFETHFDRYRPDAPPDTWKAAAGPGHGALYDLGSHLIDQVYNLFGMPKSVTAFVGNQRRGVSGGAPDFFTALLEYPGMLVTSKASVISPEEDQLRYWVRGSKGSFKKYHLDVQEDQLKAGKKISDAGVGEDPEAHFGTLTVAGEGGKFEKKTYPSVKPVTYVEFYRTFAKALRGDGNVPVSAEEGRDLLRILEAAQKSDREGRKVTL